MTEYVSTTVPAVLVNLSIIPIYLDKKETQGFLDKADVDISKITTSNESEPLTFEATQEQLENVQQQEESKFICFQADTLVHRKVDLQSVEVNDKI